jgi:hypothetical protein
MTTKTLSREDAYQYVIRAEDHIYDKKSADASGRTVQKIAVALANADGGEFAVGIRDEDEEIDPDKRWNGRETVGRRLGRGRIIRLSPEAAGQVASRPPAGDSTKGD